MAAKQHIAGLLIDRVQHCVRCDAVLADHRGTNLADVPSDSPLASVLGWECGNTVYELENGDWSAYAPSLAWWESCLIAISEKQR